MQFRLLWLITLFLALPTAAHTRPFIPPVPGEGCLQEQITLTVNYNIQAGGLTEAKTKFDQAMQQLAEFVKQQNIKKFDLNSMHYTLSSQPHYRAAPYPGTDTDSRYHLNGSASYLLSNSDDAFKIGEFLSKRNIHFNINANTNRRGNCPDSGTRTLQEGE